MARIHHKKKKTNSILKRILESTVFERIILLYTIILTFTNLAGYTDINWLYVGLPFWVFIFGPAIYSYVIYKVLFGNK